MKKAIVIGAGPAGLTAAYELLTRGEDISVIVLEETGNIGVTSSQELVLREREVSDFSTIKYIVHSFKKRFCVMVY